MPHGYGNGESEMMRIPDAVYTPARADATPAVIAAIPNYVSFRATYTRSYMGDDCWCSNSYSVDERQCEYVAVGDTATSLLGASAFAHHRKIPTGFSQGGYLPYRLVKVRLTLFNVATLLGPSFMGEEQAALDFPTRLFPAYGVQGCTIPLPD